VSDQVARRAEVVSFELNGAPVEVRASGSSLLDALRGPLGIRSAKDGCSPQGQCGCCTVLVDGAPRVACVTPLRRLEGRSVTTLEGLPSAERDRWTTAFAATGASQCGFCTPGIVMRLAALARRERPAGHAEVDQALLAHLCRCTGWRSILDAWDVATGVVATPPPRDAAQLAAAAARAAIEGRAPQQVGPDVAAGGGGFAEDTAPRESLVALRTGRPSAAGEADGQRGATDGWVVAPTLAEARVAAAKVQGRNTTAASEHPVPVPPGPWDVTLQTSWVEPAYLETDASWCEPAGVPASPLANGGAFGAKVASPLPEAARRLAAMHGRPVRALWTREDAVRFGPKRPPLAAGIDRSARRVVVSVARTPGVADALRAGFHHRGAGDAAGAVLEIHEVDVVGPPTALTLRAAGWAEGVVLRAALDGAAPGSVVGPEGAVVRVAWSAGEGIDLHVDAGPPLDEATLRSYCVGAAHMAAGWVCSESLTTDADGAPVDLTVRSFGVLRSVDTPRIEAEIVEAAASARREPVNASDAVFAAVAATLWAAQGFPPAWPTGLRLR